MDIKKLAKETLDEIIKHRRHLHQIPEIGNDLPQTSAYVSSVLKSYGIEHEVGIGVPHGIVGIIKGDSSGKVMGLRADMDALAIKEETGLPFASTNGNMHACGHDTHTAMLLGVAKILNSNRDKFKGTVKLIFQPAEEISDGAKNMVDGGCLKNPDVDAIYGQHVGNISPEQKHGTFSFARGPMMACLDKFAIKVIGKGSHGALPHDSIDPVVIASNIVMALQTISSRQVAPVEPVVVTVAKFHAGTAFNIIPAYAEIEGTARAVNHDTRDYLEKRIGEIAAGIAASYGGSTEYVYTRGAAPLVNDIEFTDRAIASAKKILGEEFVNVMTKPTMGGEDFAEYLSHVPGTFAFIQNPMPIEGKCWPMHNSKMAVDEESFADGAAVMLQIALDFLNE